MLYLVLRDVVYTLLTVLPLRFQNWIMIVTESEEETSAGGNTEVSSDDAYITEGEVAA